ncbi:MAG: restriction endonuclease subunit S [Lewinellaceae bacterium]|nr:restriction endonuclease subunit S [Lewinellaceae bacterium]
MTTELGNLIHVLSGYAFDSKRFNESAGIPLIRIRDVGRDYAETFYHGDFDDKFIVRDGDILVAMDGEFRVSEWKGPKAILNQRVCKISPTDPNALDKRFLLYFLPFELKKIEDRTSFVTVKHLSVKSINSIQIPLPPLPTQRAIADRLDRADALRQKDRQLLREYDALAEAVFVELFGDPVRNEKGWEEDLLKNLVENHDNKRVPIKELDRKEMQGMYPYYGATGIIDHINDYIFDGKFLLVAEDGKNLLLKKRKNAFIAKGKFWVNNHAHILSVNERAAFEFLEFALNKIDFKPYVTGIDQYKLTRTNLDRIKIICPPASLQNRFAKILANIEQQKALVRQQQAESEALFGRLLQEAFG